MSGTLNQALALSELGWTVLPIPHKSKHPGFDWKRFQTQEPSVLEMRQWFAKDVGMAAVCGSASGNLVALDFDTPGAYDHFQTLNPAQAGKLPTDRRGDRYHVLVRTSSPNPSRDLYLEGFAGKAGEILAEGKLCVLPPTLHPSGEARTWLVEPKESPPVLDLESLGIVRTPHKPAASVLVPGSIPEGARHNTLLSLAGRLRATGLEHGAILTTLETVNAQQCQPPLPQSDVQNLAEWVCQKPPGRHHHLSTESWDDGRTGVVITTPHPLGDDDDERFSSLFKSCPEYLADAGTEEHQWVVEGLLPESYLVVIGGTSKSGKSCLATSLAMAVSTGEPFLGMPTNQGSVLWCAYEESEAERAYILRQYQTAPESLYITHQKLHIDSAEGIAALRWCIRKYGVKLLVLDPLYGSTTADSLSDGRKAREVLSGLKELCRTESVCAVVLHHFTKNVGAGNTRERFADSNQILATASMDLRMETTLKADEVTREIKLSGSGRGAFANQTWHVVSGSPTDFQLVSTGTEKTSDATVRLEALLQVLSESEEPLTAEEIARRARQNTRTVKNRLTELQKCGRVMVAGTFLSANLYGLPGNVTEGLASSA